MQQRTPVALSVSWLKFEPKVSNFSVTESGEPVSITTATGKVQSRVSVMFVQFEYTVTERLLRRFKSKKQKFFVVKVMETRMASITGKNRDQGSIFSQETARATGDLTNKKYFFFLLLLRPSKWLSMQIFIKIWYTENNIVKN